MAADFGKHLIKKVVAYMTMNNEKGQKGLADSQIECVLQEIYHPKSTAIF